MSKNTDSQGFLSYLISKDFLKQVLVIIGGLLLLIFLVQLWLRFYTNHGQKLELPKYIGKNIDDVISQAEDESFEIIVSDSVFIVGKGGGIVTDQNPKPGALVKENRKIYVTVTKHIKESVKVKDLPVLYGNAFEQKKTELKYRDIDCVIKDYIYDPGEPNHILEVYYKGQLIISKDGKLDDVVIEKGGTLECVVSQREGGEVIVPELVCLDMEEAKFLLATSKLEIGDIIKKGAGEPDATWYIIAQSPAYDGITNVQMGSKITVTVSTSKPSSCL